MAGFFKRVFGHFGLFKDNHLEQQSAEIPPSGFPDATRRSVLKEKGRFLAPVISQCTYGAGGVQGLQWYAEKLMMDEDGDVAQEFLNEVIPQPPVNGTCNSSNFEVKLPTQPVKLKGPLCTSNGNVHQSIESSTGVHWS